VLFVVLAVIVWCYIVVLAVRSDEDFDERRAEMLSESLETDSETMGRYVDTLGFILRAQGTGCLAMVGSTVLPVANKLLEQRHDPGLRQVGVCLYDEILEHGGSAAIAAVAPTIAPHLLEGVSSPSAELRQSCAFGLGQLVKGSGEAIKSGLPAAVAALRGVLVAADANEPHMISATDNAVASLLRVLQTRGGDIGTRIQQQALVAILSRLPLVADAIEARFVHGWFVKTLGSCAPILLGSAGERAGPLLMLLAQIASTHMESAAMDEEEALMDGDTARLVAAAAAAVVAKYPAAAEAIRSMGAAASVITPAGTAGLVAASAYVDASAAASASAWVSPIQAGGAAAAAAAASAGSP
jgi:hypothetical protein